MVKKLVNTQLSSSKKIVLSYLIKVGVMARPRGALVARFAWAAAGAVVFPAFPARVARGAALPRRGPPPGAARFPHQPELGTTPAHFPAGADVPRAALQREGRTRDAGGPQPGAGGGRALDESVLLTATGCCYPCNRAPIVVVQPDMEWLGPVTPDDVPALVKRLTR